MQSPVFLEKDRRYLTRLIPAHKRLKRQRIEPSDIIRLPIITLIALHLDASAMSVSQQVTLLHTS